MMKTTVNFLYVVRRDVCGLCKKYISNQAKINKSNIICYIPKSLIITVIYIINLFRKKIISYF